MDEEDINSYRPISNLAFFCQNLYHKDHLTERALIKVHNYISGSLGEGSGTALVLLDLSAAFHVIDHSIFVRRSEYILALSLRHSLG